MIDLSSRCFSGPFYLLWSTSLYGIRRLGYSASCNSSGSECEVIRL